MPDVNIYRILKNTKQFHEGKESKKLQEVLQEI